MGPGPTHHLSFLGPPQIPCRSRCGWRSREMGFRESWDFVTALDLMGQPFLVLGLLSGRNVCWRLALWNCGLASRVCSPCEDPGFLYSPHHTDRHAHVVTHSPHSSMPHTCTHFTHMHAVYSCGHVHTHKAKKVTSGSSPAFFQERD